MNRRALIPLTILGACVAPMAAAWLLISIGWQPGATANAGRLVLPPLPLDTSGLRLSNGLGLTAEDLRGRWHIAAFAADARDARNRLTVMRRVQLALGKNVLRVQRMVFLPKGSAPLDENLLAEYPKPLVLVIEPNGTQLLARFGLGLADAKLEDFYVIDPQGRFILTYPDATHFLGMVKDLRRLLHT
jgi:hypothetical protein